MRRKQKDRARGVYVRGEYLKKYILQIRFSFDVSRGNNTKRTIRVHDNIGKKNSPRTKGTRAATMMGVDNARAPKIM